MKKIFILAYARANVGDDLFIYMLLNKYKDVHFYINIKEDEHANAFKNFKNITIIPEKERELTPQNAKEFDGYVYVGGSIFMEGGVVYNITEEFLKFLKECKKNNIPFYYISSNFGPYYTEEYVDLARRVYGEITDICFRDRYSYNMFEDIKSVRYEPDLAFSYEGKNEAKKPNTVGMSIIDLDIRKDLKEKKDSYFDLLRNCIKDYVENDKEIYLFSFCKHEGDEKAINELVETMPEEYKTHVHKVLYHGDLERFLDTYSKMEYMICSRFHAMVLSTVFKQKSYVISYSDKINNVIKDLDLADDYLEFKDIEKCEVIPLEKYELLGKNNLNEIRGKSKKQLEKLETFIGDKKLCI